MPDPSYVAQSAESLSRLLRHSVCYGNGEVTICIPTRRIRRIELRRQGDHYIVAVKTAKETHEFRWGPPVTR